MYTHNAQISVRQIKFLLILQMVNMSMLVMPRLAAKEAGHDGYWLPIIGFVIGILYVYAITKLLDRFPGEGIDSFAPKILSKVLGLTLIGIYIIKLIIGAGLEVRLFSEMVSQILLPQTPIPVIILLLLYAVYYLIKSGIEAKGRMAELLAYFVFIPLTFVLLLVLIKPDYGQLLPLFQSEVQGMVRGAYDMSIVFLPLEFMLVIGAMVNKQKKVRNVCLFAITVITVIQIIMIAFTYMGIGMAVSKKQIWPVLTLMQSIQLPGSLLENQEILMMSSWIISIYLYICGSMYVASVTLSKILNFKRQNVTVLPIVPIVFFIAMIPSGLGESFNYLTTYNRYTAWLFLFGVPLILLFVARIRKVGGKRG